MSRRFKSSWVHHCNKKIVGFRFSEKDTKKHINEKTDTKIGLKKHILQQNKQIIKKEL